MSYFYRGHMTMKLNTCWTPKFPQHRKMSLEEGFCEDFRFFCFRRFCVWKQRPNCGFHIRYIVFTANHAASSGSARMFSFYVRSKYVVVLVVHVIGCTSSWVDGLCPHRRCCPMVVKVNDALRRTWRCVGQGPFQQQWYITMSRTHQMSWPYTRYWINE